MTVVDTRGERKSEKERLTLPEMLVNPLDERVLQKRSAAARLTTLSGARIAMLNISKPGGSVFLDRLDTLLRERYRVADILRFRKPTFAKPAPEAVLADIREQQPHAVIEALAD